MPVAAEEVTASTEKSRGSKGDHRPFAIFFAEYFPPYLGSDRRIFDLARAITDWRIEFAVTPPLRVLGGRQEDALHDYFQRHFIDGVVDEDNGGIHGHYLLLTRFLMTAWRTFSMPLAYALTLPYLIFKSATYLKERRPDLVVVAHPSYLCGVVALISAKITGIPTLLDYPDAWTPLAIETSGISPSGPMAKVLGAIEKWTARSADRVVTITHGLAGYIRLLGARGPIDVVPNGADAKRFNFEEAEPARGDLGLPGDRPIVLYSGRLEAWSGVHELIEMVQMVAARVSDVLFAFVGDGTASAELQKSAAEAGVGGNVVFLGFQPFSMMPRVIASVDIAIVPFPHTPTTEFCSPVKLFEYMLMHKPIVTTKLPGIYESVDERHVVFVEDFTAQSFADSVILLLNNSALCNNLVTAAYERCKRKFRYENLAFEFSQSMKNVVAVGARSKPLLRSTNSPAQ